MNLVNTMSVEHERKILLGYIIRYGKRISHYPDKKHFQHMGIDPDGFPLREHESSLTNATGAMNFVKKLNTSKYTLKPIYTSLEQRKAAIQAQIQLARMIEEQ